MARTAATQRSCKFQSWCVITMLLTVLVAHGAVHPIAAGNSNLHCSNHFTLYNSHCYRYFGVSTKRAYFHAQRQCHRQQSTLVTVHSASEEQFIFTLTEANSSFWIGLNDHDGPGREHREGVFKWGVGGEVEGYANWQSGEPDNKPHLDCVRADPSGWAMASGGCASTKLPFVCKKIACPQGLDLYDGVCDVILTQQTHWLHSPSYLTLPLLLLLLLSAVLICALTCIRLRSQSASISRTKLRTQKTIEEVYPT